MNGILITDVDGTLVKDGTLDINPEYYEVMGQLLDKGIQVVICSGRAYSSVSRLFSPLKEKLYFICDGGSVIRTEKEILKSYAFEPELWKNMYRSAMSVKDCDCFISTVYGCYAENPDSEMYKWLVDSYKFDMTEINSTDEIKEEVIKLSVYHSTDCEAACKNSFIPLWKDKAKLASSGSTWVDCVRKDANKGTALIWLQNHLRIGRADTYAFGDNINDMEMLQNAGHSFAVENGRPELKAVAERIIPPYWEYGALQVMKSLLV